MIDREQAAPSKPVRPTGTKPSTASKAKAPAATTAAPPVDYSALFMADPILQQALGEVNNQAVQRKTELSAARRRALIAYGGVPGNIDPALAGDLSADVSDPATRRQADEATQSGLSTLAQLTKGYERSQETDTASLAARGLLHSGALRQHGLENLGELQTNTANAQTGILGQLEGLWKGYRGAEQDAAGDVSSAYLGAFGREASQIAAGNRGASERSAGNVRAATPKPAKPAAVRKPLLRRRGFEIVPGRGRALY